MDDHFRVALGLKNVAFAQEKGTQLLIVVDFAIENDLDRSVLIRDGLMAPLQVDDRKPAKTETYRTRDVVAVIVWPAMVDGVRHGLDEFGRHCRLIAQHQFSADSTHILNLTAPNWRSPPDRLHPTETLQLLFPQITNELLVVHLRSTNKIAFQV